MESSAYDWTRMTRECVSSEKRSKNRTLSDINEGERKDWEVGGTLQLWQLLLVVYQSLGCSGCPGRRASQLPMQSDVAIRFCSHRWMPRRNGGAPFHLGCETLGIPFLYSVSPFLRLEPSMAVTQLRRVTNKALGGSAATPRKEPGSLNDCEQSSPLTWNVPWEYEKERNLTFFKPLSFLELFVTGV